MILGVSGEAFYLVWKGRGCGWGAGQGGVLLKGEQGSGQLQVTGVQQNFSCTPLVPIVPTSPREQSCPLLPPLAKSPGVLQSPAQSGAARGMGRKEGCAAGDLVTDRAAPALEPQPWPPAAVCVSPSRTSEEAPMCPASSCSSNSVILQSSLGTGCFLVGCGEVTGSSPGALQQPWAC